jgi:hypothetical protein
LLAFKMGGARPELGGDLIKLLSVLPGLLLPPGRVEAAARVAKMRAETTVTLNDTSSTILNCNNMGIILDIVPVSEFTMVQLMSSFLME